ncbi:hypothetical protein SASPL_124057 [Salvia splendens]|uniref:Uncharacterized protein n=1 Tax=Salvia splendens TaxID=180675 RepID=A0A8X8ZUK8_SALSN|nr:hypothetical protein SASPL_124057 [Salvia splendens]
MSDFHVGVGRTDSLPSISDPASSLDPIKVMIEHILVRMARLQTRMDEYDRRQSSRHTLQPDPEPPHSRGHSRPLEGPLLFTQPFAAVSVTTPPPPAPISLPRSPDIGYGSMKSLAGDIDNRESVQSRQIYYDDIVIDQLLNQDPIGEEEVLTEVEEFWQVSDEPQFDLDLSNVMAQTKDVIHSSVDVSGSIHGNNDSCTAAGLILARRQHDVEHDRVYSTLLSNWIDPFLLKRDRGGLIEEVKKVPFEVAMETNPFVEGNAYVQNLMVGKVYSGVSAKAAEYIDVDGWSTARK